MKWMLRGFYLVAGMAAVLALLAWAMLRGSLPRLDGELALPGLTALVTVQRDALGTVTIEADNEVDAMRALGYVHAQERGWQLEFNRRVMRGTLSELLGPATLETDRLMRTLGIREAAQRQVARLPDAWVRRVMNWQNSGRPSR